MVIGDGVLGDPLHAKSARRGISPEMAIRLSKAFGSAPTVWAGMQLDYDMALALRHADRINVRRIPRPDAAE